MAHTIKTVKYIGIADIRSISAAEWKQAGVKDQKSTTWSAENGFTVDGSEFADDAIKYFKEQDPEFALLEEKTKA